MGKKKFIKFEFPKNLKSYFQAAAKIYDPGNVLRYYMVEHCPAKAALSGTMGYALGGFLGLFMHGAEQSAAPAKGNFHRLYESSIMSHFKV